MESCEADATLAKMNVVSTNNVTEAIPLFSVQEQQRKQQHGNIKTMAYPSIRWRHPGQI